MTRVRTWLLSVLVAISAAASAQAHLTPNSEISLDIGHSLVAAEVIVPLAELAYAQGAAGSAQTLTPAALQRELMDHISVTSPDGRAWSLALRDAGIVEAPGGPNFKARLLMRPPPGAGLRRFDLTYSLVIDRIPNHVVLVLQRSDFDGGRLSARPRMIGGLQGAVRTLRIDPGPGAGWRGFAAAIGLGMHHIAKGHDHLLFLITLMLPAPLIARGGRWAGYGGLGYTARRLVGVVSAFTVGHSITLIGGAVLGWQLPMQPVEVLIAVSILVSSVHAWRPLFAGREPWVAGGFGLVHGLAFATLIGQFGLEPLQKAQCILGFNMGIELVQLAVVGVVAPALIVLARTPRYSGLRRGGAIFTGVAAVAWIVERAVGAENPVGRLVDMGLNYAPWLAALLMLGAIAEVVAERRRRFALS